MEYREGRVGDKGKSIEWEKGGKEGKEKDNFLRGGKREGREEGVRE